MLRTMRLMSDPSCIMHHSPGVVYHACTMPSEQYMVDRHVATRRVAAASCIIVCYTGYVCFVGAFVRTERDLVGKGCCRSEHQATGAADGRTADTGWRGPRKSLPTSMLTNGSGGSD